MDTVKKLINEPVAYVLAATGMLLVASGCTGTRPDQQTSMRLESLHAQVKHSQVALSYRITGVPERRLYIVKQSGKTWPTMPFLELKRGMRKLRVSAQVIRCPRRGWFGGTTIESPYCYAFERLRVPVHKGSFILQFPANEFGPSYTKGSSRKIEISQFDSIELEIEILEDPPGVEADCAPLCGQDVTRFALLRSHVSLER